MAMKRMTYRSLHNQKGVASLVVAVVILVTVTFVTFYTSRAVLMEQKISTNDYRSRMAFEAAQAGIDATMNALNQGWLLGPDANGDNLPDVVTTNVVFDPQNDGVANNTNTTTLANGSKVKVELQSASADNVIQIRVTSTGESDDRAAKRVINQFIAAVPPLPNIPDSPFVSRGAMQVGGAAVINNPEGHSTIWTGENVSLGGDANTATNIADPTSANYPNCLGGSVQCDLVQSSSRQIAGLDIIESDTSLSKLTEPEFFENFFGTTPAVFRDSRTDVITQNLVAQNGVVDKVIWVDTNATGTGTVNLTAGNVFGSAAQPVIIIIDGNLSVSGNNDFFGLVYIRGELLGSGNVTTVGGMAVGGGASTSGGNLTITYNSIVLEQTYRKAKPAGGSGSWRDF